MIVRYSESIELDPELRFAVFALAGKLEVYQRGMGLRATIKAIMARAGTSWVEQMETMYPAGLYTPPAKRQRAKPKAKASPATSSEKDGKQMAETVKGKVAVHAAH